jgi:hypothetical protein
MNSSVDEPIDEISSLLPNHILWLKLPAGDQVFNTWAFWGYFIHKPYYSSPCIQFISKSSQSLNSSNSVYKSKSKVSFKT